MNLRVVTLISLLIIPTSAYSSVDVARADFKRSRSMAEFSIPEQEPVAVTKLYKEDNPFDLHVLMQSLEETPTKNEPVKTKNEPIKLETIFQDIKDNKSNAIDQAVQLYKNTNCLYSKSQSKRLKKNLRDALSSHTKQIGEKSLGDDNYAYYLLSACLNKHEDSISFLKNNPQIIININKRALNELSTIESRSSALHNLGFVYLHGIGQPQNYQHAFNFIKMAADNHHPESMFLLALIITNKDIKTGINKADLKTCFLPSQYLKAAAGKGHISARKIVKSSKKKKAFI